MPIAGKHAHIIVVDQDLGAVPIVLDLVNPVLTLRWFIHEGGKLGFNEPQWGDSGHGNFAGRGDAYDAQGREEKIKI